MGKSDTFRKDTEKGEVVVIKSRTDSSFDSNHSELTQRELPDYWEFLVRITHIMLKFRNNLTYPHSHVILALLIRIENLRVASEDIRGWTTQRYAENLKDTGRCTVTVPA